MSKLLPCPGCPTLLSPEARTCPNCLRVRTDEEVALGYARQHTEALKLRHRSVVLAALILASLAVFLLCAEAAKNAWDRRAQLRMSPGVSQLDAADKTLKQSLLAPQTPRRAVTKQPPPTSLEWRVSGTIYNIISLRPIPGAIVTFVRGEKEVKIAESDAAGVYEINLANGSGWTLSINAAGHLPGQILDVDPSYRTRDLDERQAVVRELNDADLSPAYIPWNRSIKASHINAFAAPDHP